MRNETSQKKTKAPVRAQYAISGSVALVTLGIIYAWSIFKEPLKAMFPSWSDTNLSLGFTIIMFTYAIGTMVGAWITKKTSRRFVGFLTAGCMFAAFMGSSLLSAANPMGSLIQLYVLFSGIGGLGCGLGYIVVCDNVNCWYPDKSGFAMGTVEMGFGFGALITGGAANVLTNQVGILLAFRILGVVIAVLLVAVSFFLKDPPPNFMGVLVEHGADEETLNAKSYTTKEVVKTLSFWSLMVWSAIVSAAFMTVVDNAAPIAFYYGAPAVTGLIVSLSNGGVRIFVGLFADKIGARKVSVAHNIVIILCGVLMVLAGYLQSIVLLLVGLIVTGMAFGGTPTMLAIFIRKFYGPEHFSKIYSLTSWGLLVSATMGPTLAGLLQDTATKTGAANHYMTTMYLMLAFCVIGVITGFPFLKKAKEL